MEANVDLNKKQRRKSFEFWFYDTVKQYSHSIYCFYKETLSLIGEGGGFLSEEVNHY